MKYKTEEDQLFNGLYFKIGEHHAISVSEEMESLAPALEEVQYPKALDDWFENYLKQQQRQERAITRQQKLGAISRKIATLLLFFAAGITLTTFGVEAFRIKVYNLVAEISEKYTQFEFADKTQETDTAQKIDWECYLYPSYLPEGYVLSKTQMVGTLKLIYFETAQGLQIEFSQSPIDPSFQVDTEDAQTQKLSIGGAEAVLVVKHEIKMLIWTQADHTLYLMGSVSEKELIRMAESVKVKNQ